MSPDRRLTIAQWMGWGLAGVSLLALGTLWWRDRSRVWESPRWNDARLVVLRAAEAGPDAAGSGHAGGAAETWVVAFNPECPHCRASLARALAIRDLAHAPVRIAALIVDHPLRPPPTVLAALVVDELRWDSAGAWRQRWGHRIYGELLCFDPLGSYLRTLPPLGDSTAERRALRIGESLRRGGGS